MDSLTGFVFSIISSLLTISMTGIIIFLFRNWVVEKLKASIKYQYDLKMVKVEEEKEIRLKSEVVSELLAQWIKFDHDYHDLNRLAFQAFIWLPRDMAEELSNSLANKPGSDGVREHIKKIRTLLNGIDDGFQAKDVVVFKDPRKP